MKRVLFSIVIDVHNGRTVAVDGGVNDIANLVGIRIVIHITVYISGTYPDIPIVRSNISCIAGSAITRLRLVVRVLVIVRVLGPVNYRIGRIVILIPLSVESCTLVDSGAPDVGGIAVRVNGPFIKGIASSIGCGWGNGGLAGQVELGGDVRSPIGIEGDVNTFRNLRIEIDILVDQLNRIIDHGPLQSLIVVPAFNSVVGVNGQRDLIGMEDVFCLSLLRVNNAGFIGVAFHIEDIQRWSKFRVHSYD